MKLKDVNPTIARLAVAYAAAHEQPQTDIEWKDAIRDIVGQLPEELETSRTKTIKVNRDVIVDGQKHTIETTQQIPLMIPYQVASAQNLATARDSLERAYIEMPLPRFAIKCRPDLKRWLNALRILLPNVKNVKQATKSMFLWRKAFDDHSLQKILYLYSDKSGGSGKSWLAEQLLWYFDKHFPGGKTNVMSELKDFISPHDFHAHLVLFSDVSFDNVQIETLNNLIDHSRMSYNIKFGPKGTFKNDSMLMITSNHLPKNVNSRRWAVIDFNSFNVEDMLYTPQDVAHQAVIDFFECVPDTIDLRKLKCPDTSCMNYELLMYIIDNMDRKPSRIKEFADGNERLKCQLANLLVDLQSKHLLPFRWTREPVATHVFNWRLLGQWIIDEKLLEFDDEDGTPLLDVVQNEWAALAASLVEDEAPTQDDPPPSRAHDRAAEFIASLENAEMPTPETNIEADCQDFKAVVNRDLTHFSAKDKVSGSPEAQFTANCVRLDGSRVNLRDTNAETRPRVMAFESDSLTIEQQEENIKSDAWSAKVFSGNKSLHVLVEVPDDISRELAQITTCDKVAVYHRMYKMVADMIFKDTSHLDMACKSWLRKFRTPNGIRDNGVVQAATFNDSVAQLSWRGILDFAIETQTLHEREECAKMSRQIYSSGQTRDMSSNQHVRTYLDTPFLKITGNGTSDSCLYKAMLVCMSANDDETLEEVINKARSENWTEKQLAKKRDDIKRFLAKKQMQ